MEHRIIIENQLTLFAQKMREDERSPGTIENYVRHVRAFAAWMGGNPATKETAAVGLPPKGRRKTEETKL